MARFKNGKFRSAPGDAGDNNRQQTNLISPIAIMGANCFLRTNGISPPEEGPRAQNPPRPAVRSQSERREGQNEVNFLLAPFSSFLLSGWRLAVHSR